MEGTVSDESSRGAIERKPGKLWETRGEKLSKKSIEIIYVDKPPQEHGEIIGYKLKYRLLNMM